MTSRKPAKPTTSLNQRYSRQRHQHRPRTPHESRVYLDEVAVAAVASVKQTLCGGLSLTLQQQYQHAQPRAKPAAGNGNGEEPKTDRLLSGGIRKPKLTDEELAARMERVKLNNARLTERARKAVEDETSFQVLEKQRRAQDVKHQVEKKKRIEAEKNRKELEYHVPWLEEMSQRLLM
jgi:hypothetical protein